MYQYVTYITQVDRKYCLNDSRDFILPPYFEVFANCILNLDLFRSKLPFFN